MRSRFIPFISLFTLCAALLTATPAAASDAGRPDLPDEQTFGGEHFLIHYTLNGDDAVDSTDTDGSGVPDFVEQVSETFEHVWQVEIDQYGWVAPPPDSGEGGDDRVDVYLVNILADGYAGFANSDGGFVGDNPFSAEVERRAYYSYLEIDNDYSEIQSGVDETPLELMQATAAHEFNHAIQSGYDGFEPHWWLYESTATWMEEEVYDDVNDGVYYLPDVFDAPDSCLVAEQGWYANWLLIRLISERYGHEAIRSIWEFARDQDGFDAIDRALAQYESSLDLISRDYGVAILLRSYEEGAQFPAVYVEGTAPVGTFQPNNGVQSLGVDFVRLSGSGMLTATLSNATPALTLRLVGVRGTEADVIEGTGGSASVSMDGYDEVFALIHNGEQIGEEDLCTDAAYTLAVTEGGTPTAPSDVWPAVNFGAAPPPAANESDYIPPSDAPFTGGGEEFSETATDLEVSFDTLIPTNLPPGYEFDYAYVMDVEDFGESADYYMPGGGESANFDYLDADDNWLSITESPSPYSTLDEWTDDIDYDSPGEIRDVAGVEVLMEDLSDEEGVWFSATLIVDDLFIVVDGDHTESEVLAMVEALITAAGGEDLPPAVTVVPGEATAAPTSEPTPSADLPFNFGAGEIALFCGVCGGLVCILGVLVGSIALAVSRRRKG